MKRHHGRIDFRVHCMTLIIATLSMILISPVARADTFAQLKGYWQCLEEGQRATLEFTSREQLL